MEIRQKTLNIGASFFGKTKEFRNGGYHALDFLSHKSKGKSSFEWLAENGLIGQHADFIDGFQTVLMHVCPYEMPNYIVTALKLACGEEPVIIPEI